MAKVVGRKQRKIHNTTMKIKPTKKTVFILLSILPLILILLFFLFLHFHSIKNTNKIINPQSGWRSFTGAGSFITAIAFDKDNNLWVAGEEFGVSIIPARQNSSGGREKTIRTFDIPYCYDILCDNDGKVWLATIREGLYCYDKGQWTNYTTNDGLPSNTIYTLAIDKDNNLYCASGLGLVKRIYGRWEKILSPANVSVAGSSNNLPNSEISCIDFDNENNLWVGFSLGGVAKFNGYEWRQYTEKDGLDIDGRVNDILIDQQGTIWVATCSGIAKSIPTSTTKDIEFTIYKFEPLHKGYSEQEDPFGWSYYPANYFTSIAKDNSGNVFFANRHDPARRWNIHDARFMPFVSTESLPSNLQLLSRNYFYCITVDKDGYVWLGSYGGGIITNNSSFKFPRKIVRAEIETKEKTPLVKFAEQQEQKEIITKAYNLLKNYPKRTQAYYLGEDRITQGDWIGNYGEYAWILPGYYADFSAKDLYGGSDRVGLENFKHMRWYPYIGENATSDDGIRRWALEPGEIDEGEVEIPRVLQDPLGGGRQFGALDDHAESYPCPLLYEGPHIYLDLEITEKGIFILSLYFTNNDSHEDDPMNKFRDYTISVKRKTHSEKEFNYSPVLADCRLNDFRSGVYKRFMLKGPAEYTIKLAKNESFNTMIWGIFLDKLNELR